ncbi:MAG: 3-oxoacyl-ACP reductase family protein [Promethearchaeota archaeon]
MLELEGKTALVTGAGRALGREIALCLARRGANIVVNYNTSSEAAEEVCTEISKIRRGSLSVQADVRIPEAVSEMFQAASSKFGAVDILVNNAAINIDAMVRQMDNETWNKVLAVNATGTFYCTREAIPSMRTNKWGRIINISSVVGCTGVIGAANYAASKAAVIGFTKSVAREVARHNITANVVAPGYIDIGMLQKLPRKMQNTLLQQIPLGRFGHPRELAATVAFLASQDAAYITGQVVHVNGGFYM